MEQNRLAIIRRRGLAACIVWLAAAWPGPPAAAGDGAAQSWTTSLRARLNDADAAYAGELGVYVKDLDGGLEVSLRAEEHWYLASGIKVPVAIEVMRDVERGSLSLDTLVHLEQTDYVDGAGPTWRQAPGTAVPVRDLLERMLIESDNTASDALIRTVGIDRVNRLARELAAEGFGPITTLADVRRHAYSAFHAGALRLTSSDLLALKAQRDEQARIGTLAAMLGVPRAVFGVDDLDAAFERYYATGLNGASLSAYGRLLEALVEGQALGPEGTAYLLDMLRKTATGTRRIKAGLPATVMFAHKTGTQRSRACDLGVVSVPGAQRRLIVAACARGTRSVAESERALRAVGEALLASGVLDEALL